MKVRYGTVKSVCVADLDLSIVVCVVDVIDCRMVQSYLFAILIMLTVICSFPALS